MMQMRTHTCGELRLADAGKSVKIVGWMENVREVGSNFAFVVLRDFYGTTQVVIENEEMMNIVKPLNKESTISVTGIVRERTSKNPKLPTGDIEIAPTEITVLGPLRDYENNNENSIVLRVDYGGTSFLFTGDMEQNAEADLMDSGANVRADVLKVGHHGSPTSSSEAFLEAVAPSIAVISVGKDNDYGHPSADVLARLEALGTAIYRTDTQGEIIITSDGQTLTVTTDPTSREPAAGKDAPFIGNRNSMIVHSANCAKLPGEDNRVYFNTAEEAEEYGYQKHTCIK